MTRTIRTSDLDGDGPTMSDDEVWKWAGGSRAAWEQMTKMVRATVEGRRAMPARARVRLAAGVTEAVLDHMRSKGRRIDRPTRRRVQAEVDHIIRVETAESWEMRRCWQQLGEEYLATHDFTAPVGECEKLMIEHKRYEREQAKRYAGASRDGASREGASLTGASLTEGASLALADRKWRG